MFTKHNKSSVGINKHTQHALGHVSKKLLADQRRWFKGCKDLKENYVVFEFNSKTADVK